MGRKFGEAIRIFRTNLGLISLLTLTVWLPGNILAELVASSAATEDEAFYRLLRVNMSYAGTFGPISGGRWCSRWAGFARGSG